MSERTPADGGDVALTGRGSPRASLVQDLWVGGDPRLPGRRLRPFEEPEARIVFLPSLGWSLDLPVLAGFLETLAGRAEVIAYQPFPGEGLEPAARQRESLLERLISFRRFWPSPLPEFVVGHGLGGALALSLASEPGLHGVVALSPWLPPFEASREAFAASFPEGGFEEVCGFLQEVEPLVTPAGGELLLIAGRDDGLVRTDVLAALAAGNPRAVLAVLPGGGCAPLAPPWGRVVAVWAGEVARHSRSAAPLDG
jgi:pimeloyl-ACP methyl ester carboxylesterase